MSSIRPVFLASGLPAMPRVQGRHRFGADRVADHVDPAGTSGAAGTPTSLVNGRRKEAEGAVLLA